MLTGKGLAVCLLGVAVTATAQNPVALATRKAELQALSEVLYQRDQAQESILQNWAQRSGQPLRRELPDGRVIQLMRFRDDGRPVFYVSNNIDAADTVSTDEVWPGGSTALGLDGSGMTIGQWDTGAVYEPHPDLTGRVTQSDTLAYSGHSTHVAGTLIGAGDGFYPQAIGMAYNAELAAWDWENDGAEMAAAAAAGLLLSNHSYGAAAGWGYVGLGEPDNWWWFADIDPSVTEDPQFGLYDDSSASWDQIAFNAPYYLMVKAAGNDHTDIGPPPGEEYNVVVGVDELGNPVFSGTSTAPRSPDCYPDGYDCLPLHSVAKNILVVGAVDDLIGGYSPLSGPNGVNMADFSSWGPTDDGRIKPDLVGNGMFLLSTWWPDQPLYAVAAGTSMASPNVSGSLLLLQQHWENEHGVNSFLRADALKALAIHTADEAGSADGPDYAFGWGLLNTRKAALFISDEGDGEHEIIESSLANGATDQYVVNVSDPDAVLRATLVWMDPPGTPPPFSLDPPDLMLVNDLDLRIGKGPSTWFPWVLDPANPSAAATTGDNFRDNVEQVVVTGQGNGNYTIEVSHKGALQGGVQAYALILGVEPPPASGSGLLINEDFSGGLPPGWSIQTTSGIPWAIFSENPANSRYQNKTNGSGNFAMVDSYYGNITDTSLRTPVLDLSSNTGAVLTFKSQYNYDFIESLNVDVSTNGGVSWGNAWFFQGFNPFPTTYVLDLSGSVAGQSNVMVRFRFDSGGTYSGDYWQIDDVQLEVYGGGPSSNPPDPASAPSPADGAVDVSIDTNLNWSAGAGADSHDVYFGASSPPAFVGNQPGTAYDPGTLAHDTTYFWRIDEVNADGTTSGTEWSFTTAADVAPPLSDTMHVAGIDGWSESGSRGRWNAVARITVHDQDGLPVAGATVDGTWSNGTSGGGSCITTGTGECEVVKNNLKSNVSSVQFTVDNVAAAGHTYDAGANLESSQIINLGDPPPGGNPPPGGTPTTVSVLSITVDTLSLGGGQRSPRALVVVVDDLGNPVGSATVTGDFTGDAADSGVSGLSDGGGSITLVSGNSAKGNLSFTFCVSSVTHSDLAYDPGGNTISCATN